MQRIKLVLDTTQDGFLVVDLDGNLCEVNDVYCQMVGYSREQLITMAVGDIEVNKNPQEVKEHRQKILAYGHDRFETRHRRQDGTMLDLDVSVSLADIGDERFFFTFLRDITQYKQMEAALTERKIGRAHV